MKMQKLLPSEYDFFPHTYCLPDDVAEWVEDTTNMQKPKTFIVKPLDVKEGGKMFLTRNPTDIKPKVHYNVQNYIKNPHLIDGFKYDLRMYVFLNGIKPLRAYVYNDGVATLATETYEKPKDDNLKDNYIHMTY